MTQLPIIYVFHASDAPQHLAKLREILQKLQAENRISDSIILGMDENLSSLTDKIEDGDLVLILLTHELELRKEEIETKLRALIASKLGVKIVEIIVDKVTYDNEFITFPIDLRPIRDREDMDAVWHDIEQNLQLMFPVQKSDPVTPPVDWSKYLKMIGLAVLMIVGAYVLYNVFNNEIDTPGDTDLPITDSLPQPSSDFPGGSNRVYSADFSQWPTKHSEHGAVALGFGNAYVLQPSSNTWIGSGYQNILPILEGDFVFDVRFRIEEQHPSASLQYNLTGDGTDAESVDVYLSVWNEGNVVYSLTKGRVRSGGGLPVPHLITEETVAEREQLPAAIQDQDWTQGNKLTLKREGGHMQFFVNGMFVKEFSVSRFPVVKTSVGAAHASKIVITSIEARTRN